MGRCMLLALIVGLIAASSIARTVAQDEPPEATPAPPLPGQLASAESDYRCCSGHLTNGTPATGGDDCCPGHLIGGTPVTGEDGCCPGHRIRFEVFEFATPAAAAAAVPAAVARLRGESGLGTADEPGVPAFGDAARALAGQTETGQGAAAALVVLDDRYLHVWLALGENGDPLGNLVGIAAGVFDPDRAEPGEVGQTPAERLPQADDLPAGFVQVSGAGRARATPSPAA